MPPSNTGPTAGSSLYDHFWRQSALTRSLNRWQGQLIQPNQGNPSHSLQDCGLALSFSRTNQGQYLATLLHVEGGSIESGYCDTPFEASLLVLGLLNPEKWYQL